MTRLTIYAISFLLLVPIVVAEYCMDINPTEVLFCADKIQYQVINTINQTDADLSAKHYSTWSNDKQFCPFYAKKEYQCHKYFPICEYVNNDTIVERKVCYSVCIQGKRDQACRYFSDKYFDLECTAKDYYSSDTNTCVDLGNYFTDEDYMNGVLLTFTYCLLGVVVAIGIWYYYSRIYRRRYLLERPPENLMDEQVFTTDADIQEDRYKQSVTMVKLEDDE